jgi:transcriptional regulator with XRE-family HTH domain
MQRKTESFGTLLRRVRLSAGISQATLAKQAGIHRTFVIEMEAGRKEPSLATVKQLAGVLGRPFTRALLTYLEK